MQEFNIGADERFPLSIVPNKNSYSFGFSFDKTFESYDWFCVTLRADGGNDMTICLEWSKNEISPMLVRMSQKLIPCCKAELPFQVSREMMQLEKHFLVPCSALRKGGIGGVPAEKSDIGFVKVTLYSKTLKEITLYGARLCKTRPVCNLEGDKLVDRFGQSKVGEWANKIHSEEELISFLRDEYKHAKESTSYPDGWSKWGGWMKKRFNATGSSELSGMSGGAGLLILMDMRFSQTEFATVKDHFEYNDQPYFGRFDGECYQIGLSDVCHRQYRDVCDMFAEFAGHMYPMLDGETEITAKMVEIKRY